MFIEIGNFVRPFSQTRKVVIPAAVASLITMSGGVNASAIGQVYDDLSTGSKLNVVLLNHAKTTEKYFKIKDTDIDGFDRQYEWGQSLGLFYHSGKTQLGRSPIKLSFHLGYSHMFELASEYPGPGDLHQWNYGEKIFQSKECSMVGTQYKCEDSSGYGKMPLANIKLDWGKNKTNRGTVTIGDGFYNAGMITAATDDDALLSSYRGVMAKYDYGSYSFNGAYVIGFMSGNQDEMGDLTGGSNYYDPYPIKYDSLYTMRAKKKFSNTGSVEVAYGEAQDYLRRFHAKAIYNLKLTPQTNLQMHTDYYYNHKAGDLWDLDLEKGQAKFDEYASIIAYSAFLIHGPYTFLAGGTSVSAPLEDGNGSFTYGFGNAKGYLKLPTGGGYHGFRRDGEDAWALQAKYDFRNFGLKDLSILYAYHWGEAPIESKATGELKFGTEYEHTATLAYEAKQGAMKGFVFNLRHTLYRPDDILGNVEPGDIEGKADRNATKFTMSYMFSL